MLLRVFSAPAIIIWGFARLRSGYHNEFRFGSGSVDRAWESFSFPSGQLNRRTWGEFLPLFRTTFPDRLSVRARERISETFGKLFACPRVWRVAAFFRSHFFQSLFALGLYFFLGGKPTQNDVHMIRDRTSETLLGLAQPVAGLDWSNARKHGPAAQPAEVHHNPQPGRIATGPHG